MTPADLVADPWAFGPWCWVVGELRLLPQPIPCRGMQGLWPLRWSAGEAMVSPPERRAAKALTGLVPEVGHLCWSALTVLQPFASAIATGPKRIENRPWRRTIPPGGLWIGLHAGKALYGGEIEAESLLDCWRLGPDSVFPDDPHWPDAPVVADLPRGAMLGAMRIDAILRYPDEVASG